MKGIATVDNEENDHNISTTWWKKGIKTAFSAKTYIKNTINRLEIMIGQEFPLCETPMSESLHPEIDDSSLLCPVRHSHYRSLASCTNWSIILGRFNTVYTANIFSRFSN